MFKKVLQQGRSPFDARSVLIVREHGKMARTPLAAFFNIPTKELPVHSEGIPKGKHCMVPRFIIQVGSIIDLPMDIVPPSFGLSLEI